ncbi:phosphate acyltransferase [Striga asiatica]|uniref:Phosphate acyltransferase n=1 Tax=Striga asiatica TaxID=4170 RepID=A0A5A7RJJ1_STRAF|nr:phosphate acyltransferase [Striga asiatica]
MGSQSKINLTKPHYNISMSKRTRKSHLNLKIEPRECFEENNNGFEKNIIDKDCFLKNVTQQEKISLKQLIEGRCTLAQHFRDDGENQMVTGKYSDADGFQENKSKKITRKHVRLLSRLVKVTQEGYFGSWRKAAPLSLKLTKHK